MVEHLYVQPDFQRAGIGSALLEVAKSRRPGGLRLWVFQRNHGARAVYARHGFTEVRFTDGSDNEEQEPDVFLAVLRNGLDEQRERRPRPPLPDAKRSVNAGRKVGHRRRSKSRPLEGWRRFA
jgi:hypothetical protein